MRITLKDNFLQQFPEKEYWMIFIYLAINADANGMVVTSTEVLTKALGIEASLVYSIIQIFKEKEIIDTEAEDAFFRVMINQGNGYLITTPATPAKKKSKTPEEQSEYEKRVSAFNEWLKAKYPSVAKMAKPLTYDQITKIKEQYSYDDILQALSAMENWRQLNVKRKYGSMTLLKFLENAKNKTDGK